MNLCFFTNGYSHSAPDCGGVCGQEPTTFCHLLVPTIVRNFMIVLASKYPRAQLLFWPISYQLFGICVQIKKLLCVICIQSKRSEG